MDINYDEIFALVAPAEKLIARGVKPRTDRFAGLEWGVVKHVPGIGFLCFERFATPELASAYIADTVNPPKAIYVHDGEGFGG